MNKYAKEEAAANEEVMSRGAEAGPSAPSESRTRLQPSFPAKRKPYYVSQLKIDAVPPQSDTQPVLKRALSRSPDSSPSQKKRVVKTEQSEEREYIVVSD